MFQYFRVELLVFPTRRFEMTPGFDTARGFDVVDGDDAGLETRELAGGA